jgi:hypothetical protein
MYADPSITLGMVNSDEVIQQSAATLALAVMAPLDLDPQIILWDPAAHPEFNTISDVGQTDTKVLYYQDSPFMDYLLGSGILRRSQVDGSYDGSPSRFVAAGGQIAAQGYATNEPHAYEHEVRHWGKRVAYALVQDTNYPNYADTLAIRSADRQRLDAWLRRLVPIIQRAQVDFLTAPAVTLHRIVDIVRTYRAGFTYSEGNAEFAVRQLRNLGLVGNGSDRTLGDLDQNRLQRMISIVVPIARSAPSPGQHHSTPHQAAIKPRTTSSHSSKRCDYATREQLAPPPAETLSQHPHNPAVRIDTLLYEEFLITCRPTTPALRRPRAR